MRPANLFVVPASGHAPLGCNLGRSFDRSLVRRCSTLALTLACSLGLSACGTALAVVDLAGTVAVKTVGVAVDAAGMAADVTIGAVKVAGKLGGAAAESAAPEKP